MTGPGKRMLIEAEEWLIRDLLTEILAERDPGEVARILGDQVRELSGAKTVLLIETGEEELLYITPARRKGLFPPEEIRLFDLAREMGLSAGQRQDLPLGHPLREALERRQVDSFLSFDLLIRNQRTFQVILLDVPDFQQKAEVELFFQSHLPVMALALNNSLSQARLRKTTHRLEEFNRHLETLVRKRTQDLEEINRELQISRASALELMQEAVEQRQRAEGTLEELKREAEEKSHAERDLMAALDHLAQVVEFLPDATFAVDREGRVTAWNRAMAELTGVPAADMLGRGNYAYAVPFLGYPGRLVIDLALNPDPTFSRENLTIWEEGPRFLADSYYPDFRGRGPAWFHMVVAKLYGPAGEVVGAIESIREMTGERLAQKEREKIEAQLQQAQKMEAVGRLAGGIAHDFNNMLGVIIGFAELAQKDSPSSDPRERFLAEILKAARRSADLVSQLLAFARQQTVSPRMMDINKGISSILTMIRRLIGEDIDVEWLPGRDLWPVKMDQSQLDQILTNLCVNAADAIGGTGRISIETTNVILDEAYCRLHPGFKAGAYVLMTVTDNGCGMDQETLSHIFEPFFTTKKIGEGTGLGLAMVWGIVKQNDGFINVYSELGKGTAFRIYLPSRQGQDLLEVSEKEPHLSESEGETILLVEDEPALLEIGAELLAHLHYQVISAASPREALQKVQEYPGKIHLLITDLIMPEMNGRDLYQAILALRPQIACLFMSGYTANVIAHRGILEEGINFLAKPFTLSQLAEKVREVLRKQTC